MANINKNIIYVVIQQFILIGIPFLSIPYVSRVLGPEGVGEYSYSFSIVTMFISIFLLGSNLYAVREIAKVKRDKKSLNSVFTEIFVLRFVLLIVATIIYWGMCELYFKNDLVFLLQMIHLIGSMVDVTWLFQGVEDFKKVVVRNIFVKFAGFGSVFIFVNSKDDVWVYTVLMGLSVLIGNLLLFISYRKYVNFSMDFSSKRVIRHINQMLLLFIPSFSALIYSVLDKTMLGALATETEVGYYDQAYKSIYMITSLINATGIVMLPRASLIIANGEIDKLKALINKGVSLILFLVFPLSIGFIMISEDFVLWFLGEHFKESIIITMILAPTIIFKALGVVLGSWYLVPMEKNKEYTVPIVCGAFLSISLNIMLIPYLGAKGSAIATLCTEAFILCLQLFLLRKELNLKRVFYSSGSKYLLTAILMAFTIYGASLLYESSYLFINIVFKVFVGIILYLGVLYLVKDPVIRESLNKVLRRSN